MIPPAGCLGLAQANTHIHSLHTVTCSPSSPLALLTAVRTHSIFFMTQLTSQAIIHVPPFQGEVCLIKSPSTFPVATAVSQSTTSSMVLAVSYSTISPLTSGGGGRDPDPLTIQVPAHRPCGSQPPVAPQTSFHAAISLGHFPQPLHLLCPFLGPASTHSYQCYLRVLQDREPARHTAFYL